MEPTARQIVPGDAILPELRGVVSLAYEGGDRSHAEIVIPKLTSLGLRGTFFLPSEAALGNAPIWSAAQFEGHEMASHSLFGVTDERGNLPNWTLDMVREDLQMSRSLLTELFPRQTDFAFAYPGDQFDCVFASYDRRPAHYREEVERMFRISVMPTAGYNSVTIPNTAKLKSTPVHGMSPTDVIQLCERAERDRQWLILSFSSVGTGADGYDLLAHNQIVNHIAQRGGKLDSGTVSDVALRLTLPSTMAFLPQESPLP